MNLAVLQRQFREWLTGEDAEAAACFGDAAAPGLSVYLSNYRSQLMATLADSYPVVRAWLGDSAFLGAAAPEVKGLADLASRYLEPADAEEHAVAMELVLEGLHQSSMLSRERTDTGVTGYKDMLKQMLSGLGED